MQYMDTPVYKCGLWVQCMDGGGGGGGGGFFSFRFVLSLKCFFRDWSDSTASKALAFQTAKPRFNLQHIKWLPESTSSDS